MQNPAVEIGRPPQSSPGEESRTKEKEEEKDKKDKGKRHITGGGVTICPAFVSRRKDKTAPVARSSLNKKTTAGALGYFHPQSFPTSFYMPLI